jgi:hypothetical protein
VGKREMGEDKRGERVVEGRRKRKKGGRVVRTLSGLKSRV